MNDAVEDTPLPDFAVIEPMLASISEVTYRGTLMRFLVANPFDHIQAFHARGELYETEALELIEKHFPAGGSFVDIGANVGNHAVFAARHLGAARVIAFEPGLVAHTILSLNKALNDALPLDIRKVALSDARGQHVLATPNELNLGGSALGDAGPGQWVEVSTADAELTGAAVSFIKIDVEGHELAVLRGLEETLRREAPVMFVEVRDCNRAALDAWLATVGYTIVDQYQRYLGEVNYLLRPL